ncbi:MAG: YbgC/YbaW family acyl-CoA thioester hydrolase [Planctomycetota bacterium]|jgi:YbgC/YbaW family acyl-CoA thioester hydrolase
MATDRVAQKQFVRSYELDPYKHVNNGAYVNWLENGREMFLRAEGRDYYSYPTELDAWFVVVNINCDFMSPALAGEEVEVSTRLAKIGNSSVVFRQTIRRTSDNKMRARARVVMCFADSNDESMRVPEDFRERYTPSTEGDIWINDEGGERGKS